ncbi:MAG: hypothetical protein WC413_01325 [Candidatus Nanoarchaeia archaeon]
MLYVGCDESNHGKTPEIYVASFSRNDNYVIPSKITIPKKKKDKRILEVINNLASKRDVWYAYCMLTDEIKDYCESRNIPLLPTMITNLLKGEDFIGDDFSGSAKLYMDGNVREETKKDIAEKCEILFNTHLEIICNQKLDQCIPLVNFSDTIARYIYRKYNESKNKYKIIEALTRNKHYKEIIF